MTNKVIDLYDYCKIPRGNAKKGYLTVYLPSFCAENRPKIRPAMLVIPGGGYWMCSERESEPVALRFLANGFAAFVLDYEVQTGYPSQLIKAAMAMKYIRDNAEEMRIAADKVAAIGFSAGGHLLGTLSLRSDAEEVKAILGDSNVKPNAAIFSYSVISMERGITHDGSRDMVTGNQERLVEFLSLEKAVDKAAPPAFIWHTADDDCVPVENSICLATAYRNARVPFELHIFPHGRHGLSLADAEMNDSFDQEGILPEIAVWFPLALTFLTNRGFKIESVK